MAHGGKRTGSGRKPKADEIKLLETIKAAVTDDDFKTIWQKIAAEAKEGSPAHTKILFEYYYGKPKETIAHELPGDKEFTLNVK